VPPVIDLLSSSFAMQPLEHGRRLAGGDLGDTLAIFLILIIVFIAVCAFLGWYSRRRG